METAENLIKESVKFREIDADVLAKNAASELNTVRTQLNDYIDDFASTFSMLVRQISLRDEHIRTIRGQNELLRKDLIKKSEDCITANNELTLCFTDNNKLTLCIEKHNEKWIVKILPFLKLKYP